MYTVLCLWMESKSQKYICVADPERGYDPEADICLHCFPQRQQFLKVLQFKGQSFLDQKKPNFED